MKKQIYHFFPDKLNPPYLAAMIAPKIIDKTTSWTLLDALCLLGKETVITSKLNSVFHIIPPSLHYETQVEKSNSKYALN